MVQDQNIEQIVKMCQSAIIDIVMSVGGFTNILADDGKMALINMMTQRIAQLGVDVEQAVGPLLAQAYMDGIDQADSFLSTEGMDTTVTGINKQMHLAGVEQIVTDTMQDMSASFRTALIMGIAQVDDVLEEVKQEIAKGMIKGDPSGYTARKVEQAFAKSGMTAFITSDGKKLPLDFYAQTVTRTKYRVAHTTGATNRYKESGVYHIKVDEHSPTCHVCARFQGMVIALDPDHAQGFPVAGDGDAKLPPYHPNCQHTVRPFVMEGHSQTDIAKEKKKWKSFDPDKDVRSDNEKEFYKTEQDIRRKARQELKDYENMKREMGDDAPKTIGAYRRMKRKNDEKWKALQQKYKEKMAISNATGPTDPGTPKKKKGSKVGSSGPSQGSQATTQKAKKKSSTTKKATGTKATTGAKKKAQATTQTATKTPPVQNVQATTSSGMVLKPEDQKSIQAFDQVIDGIEFNDRRKTSNFILSSVKGWNGKTKIAKLNGAWGHCAQISILPGNKINIGEFALHSNDGRPIKYQWKTMFHEFFHANLQGLPYAQTMFKGSWTKWEETATECSAHFMSDRAGIDMVYQTPSYSNYLIETLPQLKKIDEFKDCVTMKDFGARFMKYRFDPDHATGDWTDLDKRVKAKNRSFDFKETDRYFVKHYSQHIQENLDQYAQAIAESTGNRVTDGLIMQIRDGLWDGCVNGKVNREIRLAMPIAFNELGVF